MNYNLKTLRGDVFGGVTAMVVALPLSLAYGVASGMGAAAGLYGAIAVGFFAALFGGTRTVISGPAPSMTVAIHATNLTEALIIVVLGGLLQMLLGALGAGRFVVYTPYVVVSGFMSGIGVIIMTIEVLPFLGAPPAPGGFTGAVLALPEALAGFNADALGVAAATLAAFVFWPRRFARFLPPPLVALAAGALLGVLWLDGAPTIGRMPTGLPGIQLGLPSAGFLVGALQPAIVLALLGSIDSLLAALVADSISGRMSASSCFAASRS